MNQTYPPFPCKKCPIHNQMLIDPKKHNQMLTIYKYLWFGQDIIRHQWIILSWITESSLVSYKANGLLVTVRENMSENSLLFTRSLFSWSYNWSSNEMVCEVWCLLNIILLFITVEAINETSVIYRSYLRRNDQTQHNTLTRSNINIILHYIS